jgi:hypothetical protein
MTCEEFEQILERSLGDRGAGWLLSASWEVLVDDHMRQCPACAAKIMAATRLENALAELRISTQHLGPPPAMERNLVRVFENEQARQGLHLRAAFALKLQWASIAALSLVVIGLLFLARLHPSFASVDGKPRIPSGDSRVPAPTPTVPVGEKVDPDRAFRSENQVQPNPGRRRQKFERKDARIGERSLPAPESDELALNGGASIVRVTLPLSSLTGLRVPVGDDLLDPRVTADVWVGPFGGVMRVRLVAENGNPN